MWIQKTRFEMENRDNQQIKITLQVLLCPVATENGAKIILMGEFKTQNI